MVVAKKMVVNTARNMAEEISLADARRIKTDARPGDEMYVEENPFVSFGRIAAQTAKQIIIQKIKESEKNIVYDEYKDREGELINGYLQRKTRDAMFVDLGRTEGILPYREQSPLEHYKTGDRIKALILAVQKNARGPEIRLSRAHPKFIEKLFEMEIPEIYDGVVRIVNVVREPGMRTKIAVTSERDDVDSVGACVGMKGIRIQSIVRELEGEKIDIVEYSPDKRIMASNALTPSAIREIVSLPGGGVIAVVENEQYKLAVGKAGHNVRLAAKLCGFEIDIKTEEQYREFLSSSDSRSIVEQLFSTQDEDETPLEELQELDPRTIKLLETGGVFSVEDLVEKSFDDLIKIDGIGEKTARRILEIVADSVDFEDEEDEEGDADDSAAEAVESDDSEKAPEAPEEDNKQ
jgi:N utilization substance protein A